MKYRIDLEEALLDITSHITPLEEQVIPLEHALGRRLSQDIFAPHSQPPFPRSPLDGYALRAKDTRSASEKSPVSLRVTGCIYAGDAVSLPLEAGQAVRIMTGAMLPDGCDCVIRQEETACQEERVILCRPLKPYENYVPAGSDFSAGARLLSAGAKLDASALGILAMAGCCELPVRPLPMVGLLTTGDEVVAPSVHPLPAGKIHGANGVLLTARMQELGLCQIQLRHAADEPAQVAKAMAELAGECDCVITTGGVSVGEKDMLHQALPLLGAQQIFWRLKLKPGSPAMFSLYHGKPILSLSGNPFAALATFELLGRPMLAALSRTPELGPRRQTAVLTNGFPKESRLRRFVRASFQEGRVTLPADHSSGALFSLLGCNCLAEIPPGSPPLEAGASVTVYL